MSLSNTANQSCILSLFTLRWKLLQRGDSVSRGMGVPLFFWHAVIDCLNRGCMVLVGCRCRAGDTKGERSTMMIKHLGRSGSRFYTGFVKLRHCDDGDAIENRCFFVVVFRSWRRRKTKLMHPCVPGLACSCCGDTGEEILQSS